MKPKHKRLSTIVIFGIILIIALALIFNGFRQNIVFFYSPTEITDAVKAQTRIIRVGGLVREGSVKELDADHFSFILTDMNQDLLIDYIGILPPMFREKQGIVAKGSFKDGLFFTTELLTKHDENYMPKEVVDSLKKTNMWQHEQKAQ